MDEKNSWIDRIRAAQEDTGWGLLTGDSVEDGAHDLPPGVRPGIFAILGGGLIAGILVAIRNSLTTPSTAASWVIGIAIAVSLTALVWGVARLVRANQNFRLLVCGQALFSLLLIVPLLIGPEEAKKSLTALDAVPIAVMVLAVERLVRKGDELQKRIVLQGFAIAFVVTLIALTLASIGEKYTSMPRVPTGLWAAVLVIALGVGYLAAARRYRD